MDIWRFQKESQGVFFYYTEIRAQGQGICFYDVVICFYEPGLTHEKCIRRKKYIVKIKKAERDAAAMPQRTAGLLPGVQPIFRVKVIF